MVNAQSTTETRSCYLEKPTSRCANRTFQGSPVRSSRWSFVAQVKVASDTHTLQRPCILFCNYVSKMYGALLQLLMIRGVDNEEHHSAKTRMWKNTFLSNAGICEDVLRHFPEKHYTTKHTRPKVMPIYHIV